MLAVLADQCINRDVRDALRELSSITLTYTGDVGLATAPDLKVFEYARKHGFVLFTFDHGFGNIHDFDSAKTEGIVIAYVENFGRELLLRECKKFFKTQTPLPFRS